MRITEATGSTWAIKPAPCDYLREETGDLDETGPDDTDLLQK